MRPLVIPCSGAAGHHRRFHTAAATSKKFPFSTFYVLIHHYCYSPPNVDSLFLAGLRHGVGIGGSPLARFGLYWWWCWGPKGHSLLLLLTLWWPLAGPNGNLTHFFFFFFLIAWPRPVWRLAIFLELRLLQLLLLLLEISLSFTVLSLIQNVHYTLLCVLRNTLLLCT